MRMTTPIALTLACLLGASCGEDTELNPGHLTVSSTTLDIKADDDAIQFIVSNDGGGKVVVTFSSAKFSVEPDVVSLQPGEDATVTVQVRDGADREDGSVTLTGDNGQTVRVGVSVEADGFTKARAAEEFRDYLLSLPLMQRTEETELSITITMWGFQLSLGELEAVRVLMVGDVNGIAVDGQIGALAVSPTDQATRFEADINWYQTFSQNLTLEEALVATTDDLIPDRLLEIDRNETLVMSRAGAGLIVDGVRFEVAE